MEYTKLLSTQLITGEESINVSEPDFDERI